MYRFVLLFGHILHFAFIILFILRYITKLLHMLYITFCFE